jgi:hypothetical protein
LGHVLTFFSGLWFGFNLIIWQGLERNTINLYLLSVPINQSYELMNTLPTNYTMKGAFGDRFVKFQLLIAPGRANISEITIGSSETLFLLLLPSKLLV